MLLITGEDPAFLPGNKAFLDFASTNSKDVLRFAYVYQRQQQPLCQALLHNQGTHSPQVSDQKHSNYHFKSQFSVCYCCTQKSTTTYTCWQTFFIYPERNAMQDLSDMMCRITDMCSRKMVQRLKFQPQCSLTLTGGDSREAEPGR